MHKKKFSDEQQELVALLPDGLPKMTDSAKLVLANIILLYGRDFAKENGYAFRSYEDMMKDTGIKSRTTIRNAYRKIESLGLMDVKSGNFENEVSNEFYLSDEMKQKIHFKPKCTEGTLSGTLCQNEVIRQLIEENKSFRLSINELTEQIKSLTETVKTLEKNSKCTTDTDTESLNNNYTTSTSCTGTSCKGNKKEINLSINKEKEHVYRRWRSHEETRMLLESQLRTVGSRLVDFEQMSIQSGERKESFPEFQSKLSDELDKLPSSEVCLRQDVMAYCHDLWEGLRNYTQPEPKPYKDTVQEQVRPADFNDFEHLVRSSSKSLSGKRDT